MEYKVLYRKYRPLDFDSLVGQNYTKTLLKNSINNEKISHAYIFTGPRGTGKTSSAKIFAKAINCLHPVDGNPCNECEMCKSFNSNPDIIEIDAASNNGVEEIREIINNVRLAPANSKYKVYIIDEFHMLSTSAFNALLLTLEEPPSNVVFILATTDIQTVPITVLSRCQRFDFRPIEVEDIVKRLKKICQKENINISDAALSEIAYMSNGGLRDALSILDQISSKDNGSIIEVEDITSNFGSISKKKIDEFLLSFSNDKIDEVLNSIKNFRESGIDCKILIEKLINAFKEQLYKIKKGDNTIILDFDIIYQLIFDLNKILIDSKGSISPYNLVEIVMLKYVNYFPGNNFDVDKSVGNKENVVKKVENVEKIERNQSKNEEIIKVEEKTVQEPIENNKNTKAIVDVRINNTFVNAKKDYLNIIKSKWEDFVIYESNANKTLLSFIIDTEVVVASDTYAILVNAIDSTNDLINDNIESLENDFRLFYNMSYKLISISKKRWELERNNYINNIKNGFKYQMIDESLSDDSNSDELEKLANEIFGNNYEVK